MIKQRRLRVTRRVDDREGINKCQKDLKFCFFRGHCGGGTVEMGVNRIATDLYL